VATVGVQCLGRPPFGGQGAHEDLHRTWAQRLAADEVSRAGDGLGPPAARQQQLRAVLERCEPELLQPGGRCAGETLGELAERPSPPQGERLVQDSQRGRRVIRREAAGLPVAGFEAFRVDRRAVRRQRVAGAPGDHRRSGRAESRAQPPRDLVQRVGRVLRGFVTPEQLDEPVRGDGGVRLEQQGYQERTRPLPGKRDPLVADLDLERAEDADHRPPRRLSGGVWHAPAARGHARTAVP